MTTDQADRLASITDPYQRELLRRVFERAADPANHHQPSKLKTLRLDPECEALRARWRAR